MNLQLRPTLMTVLVVSLLTGTAARGQALQPASLYTAEMVNGRFWKALDEPGKVSLLRGAADAIQFLIVEMGSVQNVLDSAGVEKANLEYVPVQATFEEMLQQIDAFYTDSSNANVPVLYARQYCVRKMNGSSPKDLEGYASAVRLLFSRWIEEHSPKK